MNYSPPGSSIHGDSPGKNTRVDCQALLPGIYLTQGSNPSLLHCRQILYCLSHQWSLCWLDWRPNNNSSGPGPYSTGGLFQLPSGLIQGPKRPHHRFRILPVLVPGPPDLPMFRVYSRQRPTCPELNHLSEVHLHLLALKGYLLPARSGVTSCRQAVSPPHPIPSPH